MLFCHAQTVFGRSLTPNGLVEISSLKIGDQVLSFNERTQKAETQNITYIFQNTDPDLTRLVVQADSGPFEEILTTPKHPFYVVQASNAQAGPPSDHGKNPSASWIGAGDLKVGDQLKQFSGQSGTIVSVNSWAETRVMYNLEVQNTHNFFVGAQGWLVHNQENVFGDGPVKYGEGLSKYAISARVRLGNLDKNNFAVFVLQGDQTSKIDLARQGMFEAILMADGNTAVIGHSVGGNHAESVINLAIPKELRSMVTRIYSERQPCSGAGTNNCDIMIKRNFPTASVEYSYHYNDLPDLSLSENKAMRGKITEYIKNALSQILGRCKE